MRLHKISLIADIAAEFVSSTGIAFGRKIINIFRNRPDKLGQLNAYEQSSKHAAITSLLTIERLIDECMEIAIMQSDMQIHRKLDRIRGRLSTIRYNMDSNPLLIYPNSTIKPNDIIDSIVAFHTTVVYYAFSIEASVMRLRDDYEDDPEISTSTQIREIRDAITVLESIWNLRPKGAMNEVTAKALKNQLKDISKDVVTRIENITETSFAQVEVAFKEVALKKPKYLGKGKYIENLGDIMIEIIKDSSLNELDLIRIRDRMLKRYVDINLSIDDLEHAAKDLYQRKLINSVRKNDNTQIVEIFTTNSAPKCGKCGKGRQYLLEIYQCTSSTSYVCTEDVSFFGTCQVCHKKIKDGHILVQ